MDKTIYIMDVVIDKRKTGIMYVDKANLQYAANNEVLKLVNTGLHDSILAFVKLVTVSRGLGDEEANLLYILYHNSNSLNVDTIKTYYMIKTAKSESTFNRAVTGLTRKGIAKVVSNKILCINPEYELPTNINKTKFIVIEV